jgi:hypothetical protein
MRQLVLVAVLGLAASAAPARGAPSQAAVATPEKKLAALIERFEKAQNDTYAALAKPGTDEEKAAIWAKRPGKEYVPELRAIAEEARGTETAAKAWIFALPLLGEDPRELKRVVALLIAEHVGSPALVELPDHTNDPETLRALVADSPHERVRGTALLALGRRLLESKLDSDKREGRDCLEAVRGEYGELAHRGSTFGQVVERDFYELDHLQVGMAAPDFEADDENGVKWKLSDYRGKVVVVDFWGFW